MCDAVITKLSSMKKGILSWMNNEVEGKDGIVKESLIPNRETFILIDPMIYLL